MSKKAVAMDVRPIGNTQEEQHGAFEVVKVVREFVPIHGDPVYGSTYGALLDDMLRDAFHSGHEIQEVTLHLDWERYSKGMKGE